jgi:hypothetical protein
MDSLVSHFAEIGKERNGVFFPLILDRIAFKRFGAKIGG